MTEFQMRHQKSQWNEVRCKFACVCAVCIFTVKLDCFSQKSWLIISIKTASMTFKEDAMLSEQVSENNGFILMLSSLMPYK